MATTGSGSSLLISRLRRQLSNLPSDSPLGSHRQYPFAPFQYDQDRLEKTEDLAGTVGHVFNQAFGWREEHPLVLKARGPQIGLQALHVTGAADSEFQVDPDISIDNLDELRGLLDKSQNETQSAQIEVHSRDNSPGIVVEEEDGVWGEWQPSLGD